jgi:hypothetical protein
MKRLGVTRRYCWHFRKTRWRDRCSPCALRQRLLEKRQRKKTGDRIMTSLVTHFEVYGEDPGERANFCASLFGWQIEKAPGVDYWRIQTEPKSGNGFNGGLTYRPLYRDALRQACRQ